MRNEWLVILVVLLLLFGVGPWWPYSHGWGYWPGGVLGFLLLILLVRLIV